MTGILRRLAPVGLATLMALSASISILPAHTASALSGSDFNPGYIIDDAIFTDVNTMSVQGIQSFLNSKVPTCNSNHTGFTGATGTVYNPPFVCLKDFYENPNSTYSVGYSYTNSSGATQTGSRTYYYNNAYKVTSLCPVYSGYSGTPTCGSGDYHNGLAHLIPTLQTSGLSTPSGAESAAQIIYNAAQQYTINPQVLIVLLQKEQGLVTDDWPASYEYQSATGYGCPDTAPCSSNYAGFSNQVISAAWQFRHYLNYPNNYNYVVGSNYIQYNPTASCGGSTVNIQNQATAALYDYTPYQPNAGALSGVSNTSPGGTANCGAYGNRNFWWYFNSWFGNPTFAFQTPTKENTLSGDFNGDGKLDVAMLYSYSNYDAKLWVLYGNGSGYGRPTLAWDSGANNWDGSKATWVAGDFNGDGKADITALYNYGSSWTKAWTLYGGASSFASPVVTWDSGKWNFNASSATWVAGDFNGDGKADITALYNYGNQVKFWTFYGAASGLSSGTVTYPQ